MASQPGPEGKLQCSCRRSYHSIPPDTRRLRFLWRSSSRPAYNQNATATKASCLGSPSLDLSSPAGSTTKLEINIEQILNLIRSIFKLGQGDSTRGRAHALHVPVLDSVLGTTCTRLHPAPQLCETQAAGSSASQASALRLSGETY